MKRITAVFFITIFLIGCSSNKDKEMFESASELYKAKNFSAAVTEYEKLIKEYPNSQYAEDSYFALAGIFQMNKIDNLKRVQSAQKAIEYYQQFYNQFSDSENAPKALFMIGFMRANDLNEYDSARLAYNEFLKKFPEHELAPSVKMELDNLGLTPDQIIEQQKSASK